jgi:hypothetical protein
VAKLLSNQDAALLSDEEKLKLKKMNAVMKDRKDMAMKIIYDYSIKPDFKKKS